MAIDKDNGNYGILCGQFIPKVIIIIIIDSNDYGTISFEKYSSELRNTDSDIIICGLYSYSFFFL